MNLETINAWNEAEACEVVSPLLRVDALGSRDGMAASV